MTLNSTAAPWFTWVDKVGLILAATVLAAFFLLWALLMFVAGPAPTHHLSVLCLAWMLKAEGWLVLPLWFCAKAVSAAAHVLRARLLDESTPVPERRMGKLPLLPQPDIWIAG